MAQNEKDDWDLVKRKLAAILSVSQTDAGALIREGHRDEVPHYAEQFRAVAGTLGNKWLARLQAGLLPEQWQLSPEGARHLAADGDASMRYLSQDFFEVGADGKEDGDDEAAVGKQNLEARELLFRGLDAVSGPYHPMTEWLAPPDFQLETHLPLNGDSAFSEVLIWLENELNRLLQERSFLRRAGRFNISTPTPPHMIQECSREVLAEMKDSISAWCSDNSRAGELPDSLSARISANVSANRALLEYCSTDRLGRDAAHLSAGFLHSLNACGKDDMWPVLEELDGAAMSKRGLANLFKRWFGYGGELGDAQHFVRRLADHEIDAVVNWSTKLQQHYIGKRGGGKDMDAQTVHGQPFNLLVFGMATLSTFYVKEHWHGKSAYELYQAPKELPPLKKGGTSTYSVAESVVKGVLSAHAADLVAQVYSQMYFGNSENYLRATDVQAYARTQNIKRAHQEQMLEHAVKGRSSQELMNLFSHVHPIVQAEKERAMSGR